MTLARLYIVNFAAAVFLAWAWVSGYVDMVTAADPFHVTRYIAGAFLAGAVFTFWRVRCVGRLPKEKTADARREGRKAEIRNRPVGDVVESLSMLGIIGTAIGMLYAFGEINQDTLGTVEGFKDAAVHALIGVKLLAGATLAAVSFALWTVWNNRILETATALHNEELS